MLRYQLTGCLAGHHGLGMLAAQGMREDQGQRRESLPCSKCIGTYLPLYRLGREEVVFAQVHESEENREEDQYCRRLRGFLMPLSTTSCSSPEPANNRCMVRQGTFTGDLPDTGECQVLQTGKQGPGCFFFAFGV